MVEWLQQKMRGGLFVAFASFASQPTGGPLTGPPTVRLTRAELKAELARLIPTLKRELPNHAQATATSTPACGGALASAAATAMDTIDAVSSAQPELSGSLAKSPGAREPDVRQHALRLLECAVVLLADVAPADGGMPASAAFVAWSNQPTCRVAEIIRALELATTLLNRFDGSAAAATTGMVGGSSSWPWLGTLQQAPLQPAPPQPAPCPPVPLQPAPPAPTANDGAFDATAVSAKEHADRAPQVALFTPAVRRDIYAVLLNPNEPGAPVAAPSAEAAAAAAAGRVPFEVVLLCKSRTPGGVPDTFLFVDRPRAPTHAAAGFAPLDDAVLLQAISKIGSLEPTSLAATKAFEAYLTSRAKGYTDQSTARLSVEFLVAFGAELTPRLNVDHRARVTTLSEAELRTLTSSPFASFVDQNNLRTFQTLPTP